MFKVLLVNITITIRNYFSANDRSVYKWHIVMVTLATIITVRAIVLYPIINDHFLPPFRQTHFEFFNGGLDFWKFGTEEGINLHVSGPICGEGINTFEFGQNLASKSSSRSTKSIIPMQGKRKQYQNKCSANPKQPEISGGQI